MRAIDKIGIGIGMGILATAACVSPAPTTEVVESPVLDGSGNWYGLRPFDVAMGQTASNIGFSPFVANALSSTNSLTKLTTAYEEITGIVGETTAGTNRSHVAKFATRVFTKPSDGITNVTSAALSSVLVGNKDGSAASHTPPTGCGTTLGGVTVTMYMPDNIDAATELLRTKFSASDQGIYTFCRGTVIVYRDSALHGQKLDGSNNVVSVTLTPTCSATDAADVCIGKQIAAAAGRAGVASLLANNASVSRPTVDSTSDSDANIRSGSFPLTLNLTLVQDTGQSQMNGFWSKIFDGGTGSSTFETKLVQRGATACDSVTPLHCS